MTATSGDDTTLSRKRPASGATTFASGVEKSSSSQSTAKQSKIWQHQQPQTQPHNSNSSSSSSVTPPTYRISIMFDGGARGNPGVAGCGASITLPMAVVESHATTGPKTTITQTMHVRHFVGMNATNNDAEYRGLLAGLSVAAEHVQTQVPRGQVVIRLIVQGDSKLIIQQLNGAFQVKNENLKPLFQHAQKLIRTILDHGAPGSWVLHEHVYRSSNHVADGTYELYWLGWSVVFV